MENKKSFRNEKYQTQSLKLFGIHKRSMYLGVRDIIARRKNIKRKKCTKKHHGKVKHFRNWVKKKSEG